MASSREAITASDAPNEELSADWTPERQVAQMLELCEAQMESALTEADHAVDSLVKAFTTLADTASSIGALAKQSAADGQLPDLQRQAAAIREQVSAAVVAFQFYDKLTQRLGHVRYSLSTLAMFVCDRAQTGQREQWQRLFGTLRRLYRTEEEREIFQLMVQGASAEEAQARAHEHSAERETQTGEVELF